MPDPEQKEQKIGGDPQKEVGLWFGPHKKMM